MLQLEVLIAKLLAVDGLSARALWYVSLLPLLMLHIHMQRRKTYVATGEVTTLKHELGNDSVELGARVAEALLAGAEGTEVLSRLGDDIVEELEVDAALLIWKGDLVSN